ncbi:MAG TPA: hypothetical protein VM555_11820 [Tahibacter sp.]|nr:hypothetical protein [Tahibacter sp.]
MRNHVQGNNRGRPALAPQHVCEAEPVAAVIRGRAPVDPRVPHAFVVRIAGEADCRRFDLVVAMPAVPAKYRPVVPARMPLAAKVVQQIQQAAESVACAECFSVVAQFEAREQMCSALQRLRTLIADVQPGRLRIASPNVRRRTGIGSCMARLVW